MHKLIVMLCLVSGPAMAGTVPLLGGPFMAPRGSPFLTNTFPRSIDGNGTVQGYIEHISVYGTPRRSAFCMAWYAATWDVTGTLVAKTYISADCNQSINPFVGQVGPNGFDIPPPVWGEHIYVVTNGLDEAYSDYEYAQGVRAHWQGHLTS